MTHAEIRKLDMLVQDLNSRFNEDKTLEGFMRFCKKCNGGKEPTFKEIKSEIDDMYERLADEESDNTW